MTNYILIDARTRAPVPLPYEAASATVVGFSSNNLVLIRGSWQPRDPADFDLTLITEAEFMAERDQ